METTDRPMSPLMKVVFWFVAANALAGALLLILFPGDTARLFFWEIKPPINAALFGALYLGGAAVVALVTYGGRWEPRGPHPAGQRPPAPGSGSRAR